MQMRTRKNWLAAAIVVSAVNMRAPITGVGSLLRAIQPELGFSATVAGMVTTIPLLAFALVSPMTGPCCRRLGPAKTLILGLSAIVLGILIRSYAGLWGFFLGTMVVGCGIAVINVLLPALIKSVFPDKVGVYTSLFTTGMAAFAGVSAGLSVPIAASLGWRGSLAVWILPAMAAVLFWLPHRTLTLGSGSSDKSYAKQMLRSPTARWVAVFMGVQSLLFYGYVAWLPTILQSKGMDVAGSGFYASIYQYVSIAGAFVTPILAGRSRNQKGLVLLGTVTYLTGLTMCLLAPSGFFLLLSVIICGWSTGSCISLAMTIISLRAENAQAATALSGMAQSFGYGIAAVGPFIMGAIFDLTASWTAPMLFLIADVFILFFAGLRAGEDRYA